MVVSSHDSWDDCCDQITYASAPNRTSSKLTLFENQVSYLQGLKIRTFQFPLLVVQHMKFPKLLKVDNYLLLMQTRL